MSSFAAGDIRNPADADGVLRRQKSTFRDTVSSAPGARHPPAKGRYVLYLNYGCPWAQRANIVRTLKGLEDVVELAVMGIHLTENGWVFDGEHGSAEKDPLYGFTEIRQLYWKANPEYKAVSTPTT
jgi:putative glutathione S-transferase